MTARRLIPAAVLAAALAAAAPAQAAPNCDSAIASPNAIVIEVTTGTVVCERAADAERPVGSAQKMMTALVTLERAKLSDTFTASSYRPASVESKIGLMPGEKMKVRDLLRGLLIESGNDAAMALAVGVAGSERSFVRLMNRRARQLGLKHTRFKNPVGLDEAGQHSSARDLVTLAMALRTKGFARRTMDLPEVTLQSGIRPRKFRNRNLLVRETSWINGVKTGRTRGAGWVLVGSGRRGGIQLVSAVLGASGEAQRMADTRTLLRGSFARFQRIRATQEGQGLKPPVRVPIRFRRGAQLELVAGETVRRIIVRGRRRSVTVEPVSVPREVAGPLARGERLGEAEVLQDGRRVATIPLVAAAEVPEAGVAERTKSWFTRPPVVVLAFAVLGGTVLLARRRRVPRLRRRRARDEATA